MKVVSLEVVGPLASGPMLGALAAHSLPGVQETRIEEGTVRRVLELDGLPTLVEVRVSDVGRQGGVVELRLGEGVDDTRTSLAVQAVRDWLDLDLDPATVDPVLAADARLAPLVARRPGLRVVGSPDPFEAAVTTVLGQRVSLAAARVFGARFVEHFAQEPAPAARQEPGGAEPSLELRAFPRPELVARADPEVLRRAVGVTGARGRTVVELARVFAEGPDLRAADPAAVRARLLGLPGVGPWTVEYLAVKILGDRDAFPSGDLVLQRALGVRSAREAEGIAEAWRPWRAYALFHLWTQESYAPLVAAASPGT